MRVYHLLTANNALSDIALRRIRISRFSDLNDPFELLAVHAGDAKLRKAMRSWREDFNKQFGLLCFSKAWISPVLWSHYGEKHRGICLGFDLKDDLAEKVTYTADRIPVRFMNGDPAKGLELAFVRELLRTKFKHWEYEDEVRMLLGLEKKTLENGSYFHPFGNNLSLKEVILGPHCEMPIDRVRQLVQSTFDGVTVIKARLAFKWFEVVPDERSLQGYESEYRDASGISSPTFRPK